MCPVWLPHSQDFRRFLRRWGIGGENLYELLTGVIPTATVYRSFQDDEVNGWGVTVVTDTQAGNRVPAVAIVPNAKWDCLVDKLTVIAYPQAGITSECIARQGVALYTPFQGYNPIPPANITTSPGPGLLNTRNFYLPQTQFLGGWNSMLPPLSGFNPAVFILDSEFSPGGTTWFPAALCTIAITDPLVCPGASPVNPISALIPHGNLYIPNQSAFEIAAQTTIWDGQQPPLRVPANSSMVVQLDVIPSARYVLAVTILFREQNAEEL